MATYLAFLRAINLGARRKYPMGEVRAALNDAGFTDVATYINTGNVRLTSRMRSRERVAERLADVFAADRGFEVPTAVFSPAELRGIADDAQTLVTDGWTSYVSLLCGDPDPDGVAALEAYAAEHADVARAQVRGRAVHLALAHGYQSAKIDNNRIERSLKVPGTSRALTVVRRVASDWC